MSNKGRTRKPRKNDEGRIRTEGPTTSQDIGYYTYDQGGSTWGKIPYVVSHFYREIRDVKHADFKERVANGELILSPLFSLHVESTGGGGYATGTDSVNPSLNYHLVAKSRTRRAVIANGYDVSLLPTQDHKDLVKMRAIAQLDSTPFNFAEDVLELKETINMFKYPLEGLNNVIRSAAQRKPGLAGASLWNYYRFAATPFVRSLSDLLESFAKKYPGREAGVRMRATGRKLYSSAEYALRGTNVYNYMDVNRSVTGRWKAGIFYRLIRPSDGVAFTYGIRAQDMAVGFWQVVPYSFMIDRVVDVSSAATAALRLADPNIRIEGGYVVHQYNRFSAYQSRSYKVVNGTTTEEGVGDIATDLEKVTVRDPWIPQFSDIIPPVDIKGLVDDSTKIADLCSLVIAGAKLGNSASTRNG